MFFELLLPYSEEFISLKTHQLKQKPLHLGIVIEKIEVSAFQDLMNLIKWIFAASIYDITLYDSQGISTRL